MTDEPTTASHCLNCGAELGGQYCGQCGQRATSRFISLWELIRDAFGDLFELDSRLWRTLVPLLARPGRLTRDYLEGRRARYMPPFRMYLVLSLVFFVVAFFDPQSDFEIFFEPTDDEVPAGISDDEQERIDAARAEGIREARSALDELVREGIIDESLLGPDGPIQLPEIAGEGPAAGAPEPPGAPAGDDDNDVVIALGEGDGAMIRCDSEVATVGEDIPPWLKRRLTRERMEHLCERLKAAGTKGLTSAMLDRVPAALILLLPFMALALKLLYPLSRRYYVEHLLFFVHFHAFFFLVLTLQVLWSRLVAAAALPTAVGVLPIVASSFYIPVYLYVSMRRVYAQGRFVTFLKFSLLAVVYVTGFSLMLLGALLLAVLSV